MIIATGLYVFNVSCADADFLFVTGQSIRKSQSIHERKSQSISESQSIHAWKILEVKESKHLDVI